MNNYQWYTEQWGKPTREDDLLFLLLTVGVFQVGLSWKAAAGKKVAFMKNFCQMKPEKVAALLPDEVDRIVADPDMIRNRRKIEATIKNAQAILKVQEELKEVLDVYKSNNKEKIKDEVGDLIFACVNVARKLNIDEEEAVNSTIQKFIRRFSFIEEEALKSNKNLNEMTLKEMDLLWEQAKNKEFNEEKKDL